MFKSKKIVALVLCAMMLFVPVAAAADSQDGDFLYLYLDAAQKASTAAGTLKNKVGEDKQNGIGKAADAAMETGKTVRANQKKAEEIDKAVKEYQEALKEAKGAVAKAESFKAAVEKYKLSKFWLAQKFTKVDTTTWKKVSPHADRDEENAKAILGEADRNLTSAKDAIFDAEKDFEVVNERVKLAKALLPIYDKNLVADNGKTNAKEIITQLSSYYDENKSAEMRALVAPQILKAWKVFVANASEYEKDALYQSLTPEVKELVGKADTKYEVMSTGEKGWILSDEAKNGCLKDVAEFKVEKKDGKFVAKVYGKDGKEMKIGQQLTVYRPIGKDVKVLKAKVDGKDVTFSVGLRNGQNYVSVPVIY